MFVCFSCLTPFDSNETLILHVRLSHSESRVFRCFEDNCSRSFSQLQSYAYHRVRRHCPEKHESVDSLNDETSPTASFLNNATTCNNTCSSDDDEDRDDFEGIELSNVNSIIPEKTNAQAHSVSQYVARLYSYSDITKRRINDMLSETSNVLKQVMSSVGNEIYSHLETSNVDSSIISGVKNVVEAHLEQLKRIRSDHNNLKDFEKMGSLILPESYLLGERSEFKNVNGKQVQKYVPVVAQFISARKVLKKFFEMPHMLDNTLDYIKSVNSKHNIMMNFIQGKFWKEKSASYINKTVFPLFMFFDDYENNNPLGSHKGISKTGAVYLTVPCLPPEYQSKLENIFLFVLFNSLDRQSFTNKMIFTKVVEELNYLQSEGIIVDHPSGPRKIYFVLSLLLGDNLGLHSLLGFCESFRANYFCRFCLTHKNDITKVLDESNCVLRNVFNYDSLLKLKDPKASGIVHCCVFHEIYGFHATTNLAIDVMHDIFEGICRYDIALILRYYIYKKKYFTLAELNNRINSLFYGDDNKPAEISESALKNNCIIMSSAEMATLITHLHLIIGNQVPKDDEHWRLLTLLKTIVDIATSTVIHVQTHILLRLTIHEYLELLNSLFPNCMKPKHHFLIHYPRIMESVGPLWKISCIRYEGKHRESKIISRVSTNRINVNKTIAVRHQLIQNYRFLYDNEPYAPFTAGPGTVMRIQYVQDYHRFASTLSIKFGEQVTVANWLLIKGSKLKNGRIIVLFSEDGPKFHCVQTLILTGNDDFLVLTVKLTDCYMDEHLQSYEIISEDCYSWSLLSRKDVCNATAVTHVNKLSNGKYYIAKKWI